MNTNRGLIFAGLTVLSLGCGTIANAATAVVNHFPRIPAPVVIFAPANRPPTFLPGPNEVVTEDSGEQTFFGWAFEISPGSPLETSQSLTFLLTIDNPFLFSSQPAFDALGTLTFTPAPGAFGTANVTAILRDDGGVDDGGEDTSAPRLFQIQVLPVNDPPVADAGMNQVLEYSGQPVFTILNGSGSYDVDDVALSFAWYEGSTLLGTDREQLAGFGPGDHIITLVVTDPGGASSQSTLLVSVRDTTPPSVLCSTNITVDATSSAGATVMFAVTASDWSSNVTISYAPPPGSTFPAGTNIVFSTAVDLAGNSASCGFRVVVRGSRAIRFDMLANLAAFRSNNVEGVNRELDSVINRLGLGFLSAAWLDDNHLDAQTGAALFNFEKQIVPTLKRIAAKAPRPILTNQLARLVRANRLLAEIAVDEAQRDGGPPAKIAALRKVIAQGDLDGASQRLRISVGRYQNAWKRAVRLRMQAMR